MAEAVVNFLWERLASLLAEEARHLSPIRAEIIEVGDELELMKAFLRDADAMEDEDESIRVWVKQIRDLAHYSEDVIDYFLLCIEGQGRPGMFGRLADLGHYVKTVRARRQLAFQLRQIKSRAANISDGRHRYFHDQTPPEKSRGSQFLHERRNDARLVPDTQLIGIQRPKSELVNWLLEECCSVRVLAVHGMGGLGKTTLVNRVYLDAQVKQRYHLRVWITVSQSFDPRDLLLKVIKQLFEGIRQPIPEEIRSMDEHSLKEFVNNFLGDKKYLIVLDDVWAMTSWESLKYAFPENNCCSRLIVTTRDCGVADFAIKGLFGGIAYPLKPLTREGSWELFCAIVFQGQPCPRELEDVSHQILERCKGLPLGIVAISGLLATKGRSPEEWERVRRYLGAELRSNDQLRDMKKILSLSFDDLRYDLKSCFMYLSIFLENWSINKQHIIDLWVAEGFVPKMGDRTAEEVGDLYFNELRNRSLIQVANESIAGEDYSMFQVHYLVREIVLQKSTTQNFFTTIGEQNFTVPDGVRRLLTTTKLENLKGNRDLSRLRSLIFLHSPGYISTTSNSMSQLLGKCNIRLLKVFSCCNLPLETFPDFITTQYNLRYLNLSGSKVMSIPSSIGRLRSLETLDLRDTLVQVLPAEILEIRRLRHLMVTRRVTDSATTYSGVTVPMGIGALTSLQTLLKIQASVGGSDLIRSLGDLKQMRLLYIQQLREQHGPSLCSSIQQLSHLRRLYMEARDENEILNVQQISSPPVYLKDLFMYGRLSKLPSWVPKLESLVVLCLQCSDIKIDPLETLESLPSLEVLQFFDKAYCGEELCFGAGGFRKLKHLWFDNSGKLRRITVAEGAMPYLQCLRFEVCKLLEEVPRGIEFLANLQELHLINMGQQLVRRLLSTDFRRIKHVPFRRMGYFNDQGNFVDYLSIENY